MSNLLKQLEELNVLKCSLLPGEVLSFVLPPDELVQWESLVRLYSESPQAVALQNPYSACRFQIKVDHAPVRMEIELPRDYPNELAEVYVRGDTIDRSKQEKLQQIITDAQKESRETDTEYPLYNLVSSTLLPLLHETAPEYHVSALQLQDIPMDRGTCCEPTFHALFTSHHLISPTKRRNLQKWASDLSLYGFAKLGYPGCIYCEGKRVDVEEFIANVKAMRWLALRLRFVEPLDVHLERLADVSSSHRANIRWIEFEKVGEMVELMREVGRETFATEMGIGTSGPSSG